MVILICILSLKIELIHALKNTFFSKCYVIFLFNLKLKTKLILSDILLVAYRFQYLALAAVERCEDTGMHCSFLQRRGLCTNRFARRYMRANCAATCEFCEGKCSVYCIANSLVKSG